MSDLVYLSLGAGVQSSALAVMSALELRGCAKAAVAIFADTGDEPAYVYQQLDTMRAWLAPRGMPVEVVSAGHLSEDLKAASSLKRKRFASIPLFTEGADGRASLLPRQCTAEYKLDPILKCVRTRLGYAPRQRVKHTAVALIGISIDEATRQKPSRIKWIENRYPLIDAGMTRSACLALLRAHGLPEPKKSACIFCPFHDDRYWQTLKDDHPVEFARAVEIDAVVRDQTKKGLRSPAFLHRSLLPLGDVEFQPRERGGLLDLFENECEGMCGV